jgi:hypothetical protein
MAASDGGRDRRFVNRVTPEAVELVGEDVARGRRVARRERRRLAVEVDAQEPVRVDVLELDLPPQPGAQPAREQVRLRLGADDADPSTRTRLTSAIAGQSVASWRRQRLVRAQAMSETAARSKIPASSA